VELTQFFTAVILDKFPVEKVRIEEECKTMATEVAQLRH